MTHMPSNGNRKVCIEQAHKYQMFCTREQTGVTRRSVTGQMKRLMKLFLCLFLSRAIKFLSEHQNMQTAYFIDDSSCRFPEKEVWFQLWGTIWLNSNYCGLLWLMESENGWPLTLVKLKVNPLENWFKEVWHMLQWYHGKAEHRSISSIASVHPGRGILLCCSPQGFFLFFLWKVYFSFLGVFPDPMCEVKGQGCRMCTDCKAHWGKFVICNIRLYKINKMYHTHAYTSVIMATQHIRRWMCTTRGTKANERWENVSEWELSSGRRRAERPGLVFH